MSTTHEVPGGTVTLREPAALPPRQKKRLKPYALALSGKLEELGAASTITVDGQLADSSTVLRGGAVSLNLAEAKLLDDMQDETTLALLEAWTFGAALPRTIDELLDVDDVTGHPGLYDALSTAAAQAMAASMVASGFQLTPENLADPQSPIGASAA